MGVVCNINMENAPLVRQLKAISTKKGVNLELEMCILNVIFIIINSYRYK